MKKEKFLKEIQKTACRFPRLELARNAAMKTAGTDPRWEDIENQPDLGRLVDRFGQVFGVEIPRTVYRKKASLRESLERKVAKCTAALDTVAAPAHVESIRADIATFERYLKMAIEKEKPLAEASEK